MLDVGPNMYACVSLARAGSGGSGGGGGAHS